MSHARARICQHCHHPPCICRQMEKRQKTAIFRAQQAAQNATLDVCSLGVSGIRCRSFPLPISLSTLSHACASACFSDPPFFICIDQYFFPARARKRQWRQMIAPKPSHSPVIQCFQRSARRATNSKRQICRLVPKQDADANLHLLLLHPVRRI
jgi:hypothetical protein